MSDEGALSHAVHSGGRLFNLIKVTSVTMSSHLYCPSVAIHPSNQQLCNEGKYMIQGIAQPIGLESTYWSPSLHVPREGRLHVMWPAEMAESIFSKQSCGPRNVGPLGVLAQSLTCNTNKSSSRGGTS